MQSSQKSVSNKGKARGPEAGVSLRGRNILGVFKRQKSSVARVEGQREEKEEMKSERWLSHTGLAGITCTLAFTLTETVF